MKFLYVTSKQMAEVDRMAVKSGLPILKMMERAGKNLASFVLKLKPKRVFVLYGKGNNGGGGIVAARYLEKSGVKIIVIPAEKKVNKNVKYQLKKLKVKAPELVDLEPKKGDVIIDALLGYNINGSPRANYAQLIEMMNKFKRKGVKVMSLDLPTGINPNTGKKYKSYVRADYILTLALPKTGLKESKNLYLINLGIPKKVYSKLGMNVLNYFSKKEIVKVR